MGICFLSLSRHTRTSPHVGSPNSSLCTPSVMTPVTITVRGWNSKHFVKANGFQMWTFCKWASLRAWLGTPQQVEMLSPEHGDGIKGLNQWLWTSNPPAASPLFPYTGDFTWPIGSIHKRDPAWALHTVFALRTIYKDF